VTNNLDQIRSLYVEAFRHLDRTRNPPPVHVTFYPYIGINHTIRVRSGEVFVRIGNICDEMPLLCHKGLAYILVAKLLRKKIPAGANELYDAYIKSDFIQMKAVVRKRTLGKKVVTTSKGDTYDLDQIFADLNQRYFGDTLPEPVLTYSAGKTYRILGHHDSTHKHITISRSLDSPDVPRYVIEYVVFHEMLHIAHPTQHINGRRYNHTAAFKKDERKFAHYHAAERWIENNVRKLKRAARAART